jgi:CRISPR-associated protein Cmr2
MSEGHLLLVSIGPVQDFIAQARRSRDLWFGSHLLSELSRAAAKSLAGAGAQLIFPALDKGDRELSPCDAPTRDDGKAPVSIANKILAQCSEGADPRTIAVNARVAAKQRWRAIAKGVRTGRAAAVLASDIDGVWNEQIEDALEFYAAWAPLADGYPAARQAAEQALAGRKNLREFRPWRHDRAGAPKSSLDGGRVSVLPKEREHPEFKRLRISDGEQLDAVGLVKRAGFEPEQFVPLVNVAAGPWLKRAADQAPEALAGLRSACRTLNIPRVDRPDLPVAGLYGFDASVLYPSRWVPLFKELEIAADPADARQWGEDHLGPLLKAMRRAGGGEPPAYVACLAADGDNMGKALAQRPDAEDHRHFSRALAEFPADARRIVEQEHLGSLIYAGGDDVLAFLPVANAPDCAAALAKAFGLRLERTNIENVPTLSVGIGVGHVLEQMSTLLDLARSAERAAKDAGRNALSIIVDKRSGGQRRLALKWQSTPLKRMHEDARLLDGALSVGKVHELEALLRRFPEPGPATDETAAAQSLRAYAEGVLAHSAEGQRTCLAALGVEKTADYASLHEALRQAIDRILVVRSLCEWGFAS